MSKVEIEQGVKKSGRRSKYPLNEMGIGDAFAVTSMSIGYNTVYFANIKHAPKKFEAGKDEDGRPMVWRIA